MKAVLLRSYGGPSAIEVADVPKPDAGAGQVLVRTRAAGINGLDWKVREGYVRDAFPLKLPVVLGIELAGGVEAVGTGASKFRGGDRVMGPLGGLGAADVAHGRLKSALGDVVGFDDISSAIEQNRVGSHSGKAVADFSR